MSLTNLLTSLLAIFTITSHVTGEEGPFGALDAFRSAIDGDANWSELGYAGKLVNCPVCLAPYIAVLVIVCGRFSLGRRFITVMALSSAGIAARYFDAS